MAKTSPKHPAKKAAPAPAPKASSKAKSASAKPAPKPAKPASKPAKPASTAKSAPAKPAPAKPAPAKAAPVKAAPAAKAAEPAKASKPAEATPPKEAPLAKGKPGSLFVAPIPPRSRLTAREPAAAEDLKAKLGALATSINQIKALKRSIQRSFWDVGLILVDIRDRATLRRGELAAAWFLPVPRLANPRG